MYEVRTDHEIIALGTEEMALIDSAGQAIVRATWENDQWTVKPDGDEEYEPISAPHRSAAIQVMTNMAYEYLGPNPNARAGAGDGYSTMVPPNIVAMSEGE